MTATRPLRAVYATDHGTDVLNGNHSPSEPLDEAAMPVAAGPPAPEREELGMVIDEFMLAADEGVLLDAYGRRYTPEHLRELRRALSHVKSELGTLHVQSVRRWHVQGMIDELRRGGLAPGRVAVVVEALHSVYGYAIERGLVDDTPVIWLTTPAQDGGADSVRAPAARRVAPPPAPEPQAASTPTPMPMAAPAPTPTATGAMVALGSSVLLWTVRATVTVFVLVVVALLLGFA